MKLRIVITDANILIDLIKLDLSKILFQSGIFEFKTSDLVFNEIYPEQKEMLSSVIKSKHLEVCESDEADLIEIYKLKVKKEGLTIQDCSVWYYATKFEGILLTGDKQLRVCSRQSGIEVRGILFLFDQMVEHKLITLNEAIEKLNHLSKINHRLPKKEIDKRLKEWGSKLKNE